MTVGELIEELKKFPLSATIYKAHPNDDAPYEYTDPSPYFDDLTSEVII